MVIVDLHRTALSLDEAIVQAEDALRRYSRLQEVILIAKDCEIVRRIRGDV